MKKLIVFDWDGTVFNSTPSITECILSASRSLGLVPPEPAAAQHIIGLSMTEAVHYLYPDIRAEVARDFIAQYRQNYLRAESQLGLFDGMHELLIALKQRGHLLAVATGKGRLGLDLSMAHCKVETLFDITRCADESRSKPHPLMLEQIAQTLQLRPAEMVMVGDTSFDLEMAQGAGCAAIGVSYGAHPLEALLRYPHLFIAPDVPSLARYLLAE